MPNINFNDTYDELSNLAIDPAEMKADEEPKKAKDLKFLEEVKKILTAKYGDVFTTAKKAEAEGLRIIDRTFTIDRPRTINLPEIEEAASLIDERLLGAFANTRDLVYKIYIYYWPTGNEYHVELYGDDACFKYYGLAGYRNYYQGYENKPEGFIKDREDKRAAYQRELDNIDAETERKKQSLQRSIDQETEWIDFMKAHTKGYEAEVKPEPKGLDEADETPKALTDPDLKVGDLIMVKKSYHSKPYKARVTSIDKKSKIIGYHIGGQGFTEDSFISAEPKEKIANLIDYVQNL